MILKAIITPILVRCVMIYKKREELLKKKFAKPKQEKYVGNAAVLPKSEVNKGITPNTEEKCTEPEVITIHKKR